MIEQLKVDEIEFLDSTTYLIDLREYKRDKSNTLQNINYLQTSTLRRCLYKISVDSNIATYLWESGSRSGRLP